MLFLLYRETRHVEYVSVANLFNNADADVMQTSINRG